MKLYLKNLILFISYFRAFNFTQIFKNFLVYFLKNLYCVVLVSSIQQHKAAIIIHTHCPFLVFLWSSSPPPHRIPPGHHKVPGQASVLHSNFPSAIRLTPDTADDTFSTHPALSLPHCGRRSILYICLSFPSLEIGSSKSFF